MDKFTPSDKQKKNTDELLGKWQVLLFMNSWTINPAYAEFEDREDPGTRADVSSDPRYHQANITFYPGFFGASDFDRENVIIHELTHCLVESMQEQIKDLMYGKLVTDRHRKETMEHSVSWIAAVFQTLESNSKK